MLRRRGKGGRDLLRATLLLPLAERAGMMTAVLSPPRSTNLALNSAGATATGESQ